jgi:pimeloyl-ACP methyl ester carboxylesterase
VRHIHYLHGFAASGRSTKAARFSERLKPAGVAVRCLDYNEPDFATLTVSRMIGQLEADLATLPPGPVALIGSSLGGFVAVHAAVRQAKRAAAGALSPTPIDRMVLLAPAFEFGRSSYGSIDAAGVERWRQSGWLEVYHWADDGPRSVHFGLYEDAQLYDSFAERVLVPTLVFQGLLDAAVDPAMVQRFVARQPLMSLRTVDDDHLLMGNIDTIVRETAAFLGVP